MDTFERSVPMSTYLVAFVVSDFDSIRKNSSKYNIQVEVYAKAESIKKGHGDFALDEASRILDFYTDYFSVKYPLVKSSKFFKLMKKNLSQTFIIKQIISNSTNSDTGF